MPRDRTETHAAPVPDSGGLRLVIDQHVVDGGLHHRVDLSYVVAGRAYHATLDGADVPDDVRRKLKALLKALLTTDPRCARRMGFESDAPSEPDTVTPPTP